MKKPPQKPKLIVDRASKVRKITREELIDVTGGNLVPKIIDPH